MLAVLVGIAAMAGAQPLAVTKVALYTSGVRLVELEGTVTNAQTVTLSVSSDQLNSLLRSLVVTDASGKGSSVDYPLQEPVSRLLSQRSIDLSSPGGLLAILPQLRGAQVIVKTPQAIEGRLVGLDTRARDKSTELWLTLSTDQGLQWFPLSAVASVQLEDQTLVDDLKRSLEILRDASQGTSVPFSVRFQGDGSRTVSLRFLEDAPEWKATYRLNLGHPRSELQGWAVVENTSNQDWDHVQLSLVAGDPARVNDDLVTPRYPQPPGPVPMAAQSFSADAERLEKRAMAPAAPVPVARPVSDLYALTLPQPVSLARSRSALVPLIDSTLEATRISVFTIGEDGDHPRSGLSVRNSGSSPWPQGPIAVYDGPTYVGDSRTTTVLPGDQRMWTFGTDLAVSVLADESPQESVVRMTIDHGLLRSEHQWRWTTKLRMTSVAPHSRVVWIVRRPQPGRTIVTPQPTETTNDGTRFSVTLPARGSLKWELLESQTTDESVSLLDQDSDQLAAVLAQSGPLSPAVRTALQRVAAEKAALVAAQRRVDDSQTRERELVADQARYRSNLEAVGRDSPQGQTYLSRLEDSEKQLDQTRAERQAALQAREKARSTLETDVASLAVN